jgi:uncharacterized protein with HEPN domain
MQPEIEKYLLDMLASANLLLTKQAHINSFEAFENQDDLIKDGVLRRLSIIGEAVFQIRKIDADFPLSEKKNIEGLRHIIVHDYDRVDEMLIYAILKKHLPQLKEELEAILNSKND